MSARAKLPRWFVHLGCAFAILAGTLLLPACSRGAGSTTSTGGGGNGGGGGGSTNSVSISVNAGPANTSLNQPLVSVTICVPGTSNCQTIDDVLVDTGSDGLRVLQTQVTLPLTLATDTNGNPLGECASFAGGTFLWGSVSAVDITLGNEKASAVPIQVIRTTGSVGFPLVPNSCSQGFVDAGNVSTLGANGILGVGLFQQDCGANCVANPPTMNVYYDAGAACVQANCSLISVPLVNQVQNPVALFTKDNNGVLISLPAVGSSGVASVTGSLIFGVGTESNNALGTAKVYTTAGSVFITATYNGTAYPGSIIDSGSNTIGFLDAATTGLTDCGTLNPPGPLGFYCPASSTNFTVTNTGNNGTSAPVMFSIFSAETLFNSNPSFRAFSNLGSPFAGAVDFGLPFFYGKSVFIAISGQNTPGGMGPYYAY